VEGHEDAYRMGWETARHEAQENEAALLTGRTATAGARTNAARPVLK
jgi:hypothetical protein